MASIAIPPFLPPFPHRGSLLVDGSIAAHLPVRTAVARGATTIYALDASLDVCDLAPAAMRRWDVWAVTNSSLAAVVRQQTERDCATCAALPGVTLHHVRLLGNREVAYDDFRYGRELVASGRAAADAYLSARPAERAQPAAFAAAGPSGRRASRALFRQLAQVKRGGRSLRHGLAAAVNG